MFPNQTRSAASRLDSRWHGDRNDVRHVGVHRTEVRRNTVQMTEPNPPFAPDPAFPQDPEFYRRVLHEWPSPVLVVNAAGEIMYGNRAIERMGNWDFRGSVGTSVLDYIHHDDAEMIAEAFFEWTNSADANAFGGSPWAPLNTRLVTPGGHVVPVVVTGAGGINDPAVGGIIYDIRPAHEQDILRRGLTGLAQGEPIDAILKLITGMIALPPLGLDAAVLEPRGDGSYRVIGATSEHLEHILTNARDPQPWNVAGRAPERTIVSRFPGGVGEDLFAAGYQEFWHTSPESTSVPNSYRIVACGASRQQPVTGPIDRLARANELASVVLLRARADALLEHAATHDRLTQLPNREGFHRRATEVLTNTDSETAAILFIDLDGFKLVNDEYGHAAGDLVLATAAKRLQSVTRRVDLLARMGGDEFVILVGASADRPVNAARVQVIADRALQELRREIDIGSSAVTISASIGGVIATAPATLEDLLAKADAAMYEAKRNHGDQHHIVSLG